MGYLRNFMSEEKGWISGYYVLSVLMFKWCEDDVNSCLEKVIIGWNMLIVIKVLYILF